MIFGLLASGRKPERETLLQLSNSKIGGNGMKTTTTKKKDSAAAPSLFRLNSAGAPLRWREDCPLWERASQIFALVILTIFPLLVGTDGYYNITVSKFIIFIVLTSLYVLACLVIGFVFRPGKQVGNRMRARGKVKLTVPQILLIAYVLWAAICVWRSPYDNLWIGQSRYEGMLSIILYSVVFLLLSFWGEYTDAYTYGLGIMGIITGFFAMVQSFGSTIIFGKGLNYWNTSFLTTIGHEDCVACLICILIPALLCGFVILKSGWRWLGVPALFLMTYINIFSDVDTAKLGFVAVFLVLPCLVQSRDRLRNLFVGLVPILLGASLGFSYHRDRSFAPGAAALVFLLAAIALGAAAWYMDRHERTWSVKPAVVRRAGYTLMLVLLILALIVFYNYQGSYRLLREISELLHGRMSDRAGSLRGYIWKCTLKIIRDNPIFGGGPGSFASLFLPYDEGYAALAGGDILIDFPHNDFLSVAACTGLVGFALYLAFLIALAVRGIRAAHRSPVLLILLAGAAGYLIYSFFVFSIAIVTPLFWTLAGLADKCVRQTDDASAQPADS